MTPRQHKEFEEREAIRQKELSEGWHYPISKNKDIFAEVIYEMTDWKINPKDVPLIIKLVTSIPHSFSKLVSPNIKIIGILTAAENKTSKNTTNVSFLLNNR